MISIILILLISPVLNLLLSYDDNSKYELSTSITENDIFNPINSAKQHEVLPDSYKKLYSNDDRDRKILTFVDFEARDQAIDIIPSENIVNLYKYIPSIVVEGILLSEYSFNGLKSAMDDIKLQTQQDEEFNLRVPNSYTLADTATMVGIGYLRDTLKLTGEGISIAVLDTGVNSSIRSFDGHVTNLVVSDLESKGSIDQDGHGTHVTGIISSNGEYFIDGEWIQTDAKGMAPDAQVYSIRVLDETGTGDNSWILEGMEAAIDVGSDIISLSLSTVIYEGENDPLQEMVNVATDLGIIVVAAAGNTGPIGSGIGIPGALDNVIAVGASFPQSVDDLELWSFSGIGPSIDGSGPDILAPGAKIISTDADDGSWAELSGTSMSTPHVSGGIALLKQEYPTATVNQIREALLASAKISQNSAGAIDYIEGQGRGEAQFHIAHAILSETVENNPAGHIEMPLIPNIVQDRNFVYHHRIMGENKTLPFYIFSSRNITIHPIVNTDVTEGVNFYLPETIDIVEGKNRIDITLEVTLERVNQANGQLFFIENGTNSILPNAYLFYDTETRYKESSILFDTSHDGDTPGAYFGNHGPHGQFSQLARRLENVGQKIDLSGGQEITADLLQNYDVLVIANPDLDYDVQEIRAIRDFVDIDGKSIFVIVSGGLLDSEGELTYPAVNRPDLVRILSGSGITITPDIVTPFDIDSCNYDELSYEARVRECIGPASFTSSQSVFSEGLQFPHFGPQLNLLTSSNQITEFAYAEDEGNQYLVAAGSEYASGGRIMVFSSQLPFDNTGILYDYVGPHSAEGNEEILYDAIDWLLEPNQVDVDVLFGTTSEVIEGTEFNHNMYEYFDFLITIYYKNGTKVNFGNLLELDLKVSPLGGRPIFGGLPVGLNSEGQYVNSFPNGAEFSEQWEMYYHFVINGSIPSDGYFSITFQLKNFDNQEHYRQVALVFMTIIMISWVVWLTNEGGRKRWLMKKDELI